MGDAQDLSQMDEKGARGYVLHVVTELKLRRRRLDAQLMEQDRWQKRIGLAAQAGRDDLRRAAEEKLIDLTVETEKLQTDVERLQIEAADLIDQLRVHRTAGISVQFATALADQLENATRGRADA